MSRPLAPHAEILTRGPSHCRVSRDLRPAHHRAAAEGLAEQGLAHGGVVFVDERTLARRDIGGQMRSLQRLVARSGGAYGEQRVVFLTR